ncbi:unnamed protein product [Closterium sp. NIES-53]
MACYRLVSGLPESLAPLPRPHALPCTPCVEGRQRAAPHSSSFPPTMAPFQTLHLDVWGPSPVLGPRQECHFRIVLDEYSRYTTVFPFRQKAVEPTVLELWLLARGGAQGLCGLRLHSDRGVRYAAHQLNLWPSDAGRAGFLPAAAGAVTDTARGSRGVTTIAREGSTGVPVAAPSAAAAAAGEGRGGATGAAVGACTDAADARGGEATWTRCSPLSRAVPPELSRSRFTFFSAHVLHLLLSSHSLEESLTVFHDPLSDYLRASRLVISRVFSALVTHPTAPLSSVSALVTTVAGFASSHRFDYAAHLVSGPARSPFSGGAKSEEAGMASYRSTGAYVDAVPPPEANVVNGMWLYKVKRLPGAPPVFKARYLARGFSQREKVDFF